MSNVTSLVPWRFVMPSTSSYPNWVRQWNCGGGNIGLDTTMAIPSRHSDAPGRCINRMRCSATHATIPLPIATVDTKAQQPHSAAMLAIGTANPASCLPQEEYPDWYFRVTKSDHLSKLKAKMERICKHSGIKKRYFFHDMEDTLLKHPELVDRTLPSLNARQSILASTVLELTATAAMRAIAEWGRPASDITHLVFTTSSGAHMPGPDLRLASLLGLQPTVQRTMMYMNGCSAASAALRVAKDIAENNHGARVLVAAADDTLLYFRAPQEDHPETLIMQAMFGDGAAAVILGVVGTDGHGGNNGGDRAELGAEFPLFEMVSASQTLVPESDDGATGQLTEDGLVCRPSPKLPALLRQHMEQCLVDAVMGPLGSSGSWNWNNLFWAVYPGGPVILDAIQAALALAPGKLAASWHVLSEYGNLAGASMIFVLDELRRRHDEMELEEGIGVMVGLGPGLTVETMVLRAASGLSKKNGSTQTQDRKGLGENGGVTVTPYCAAQEIGLKGIQGNNA